MSGAGRSTAAKVLEDLGYLVVDNLPPSLISDVVRYNDLAEVPRRLAVVVDARGGYPIDEINKTIDNLEREGVEPSLLFLDATDESLIRRFEENRRPHPVAAGTLSESIAAERELLAELRAEADFVIDTTETNVHELRRRLEEQFEEARPERPMRVAISSFGFKYGAPRDADLLFDVRFLPNPYWQENLRPLNGRDPAVRDYVLDEHDAQEFLQRVQGLIDFLMPRFRHEGKSYLSIGVGCTGGRHRSVAIAEALARWLDGRGVQATVRHRDVER
ncbi:MAG: RNase adapter RapZ [Actinobacteria bacterium]|nr:RNase adapter RapZ [Actinomycetota bacterium]